MIKEALQKLFQECLAEISALGISLPDNLLLKRVERMPEPVYIGFYDDRTEMTLAEALLKLPVAIVKAEIIGQILSIINSQQQYGQEWLTKAAKVQATYGYDMLNELDEYNLSQQPLKGQLICAKCGSHYDLRGVKCYRVWLDNGEIDKICQHCGGNMWPEPEPAAPGEPDLQALLAECLEKIHALGIKTGKIACIRWKKHATGFYGCCGEQNGEFEIQISELYRRREENVERLRDTIFHEILHTCDRCDNHDQEFWDYARRLDEAYGTRVFFAEPGHDGSPRPKRQEKIISIMLEKCVHKLQQIGIEPGNLANKRCRIA